MKVMLVMPKYQTHTISPPLGLGYLASSLRNAGHDVSILDCLLKNIGPKKFENILKKESPDVVGITAMTPFYPDAQEYIKVAKKNGAITILGGPHSTARPAESLKENPELDFIIVGEGEETIVDLLRSVSTPENVKGVAYRNGNNVVVNPLRDLISEIDQIPMPAYDIMPPNGYSSPHGFFVKNFPVASVITSRGCPFNCSFCTSGVTWRRKVRFRDPTKVVDEIEFLVNKYGVKEIHVEDDNFTLLKPHAMKVCEEIIKRGLKISLACPSGVRIDKLDRELLLMMKKAGFYILGLGIESGSQEILDRANKKLDLKIVPNVLDMMNEIGIIPYGFFIIGLPGETKETAEQTIKFAASLPFKRVEFSIFAPLPGSYAFDEWVKEKTIAEFDWKQHSLYQRIVETGNLSKDELKKLQRKAFLSFYFKPKNLWNTIKFVKIGQMKWLIRAFLDYCF